MLVVVVLVCRYSLLSCIDVFLGVGERVLSDGP